MRVIIFSKDRAAQLHACLESLDRHFKVPSRISVLYAVSEQPYQDGYDRCRARFPQVEFRKESKFKEDLLSLFHAYPDEGRVMFLVDDIIFTAPVFEDDMQMKLVDNKAILALSLRLHDGVTRCYMTDQAVAVPSFVEGCVWDWHHAQGDWGYPMSVDGNVYRRELLDALVRNMDYSNPNTFEAALSMQAIGLPKYMCCYTEAPRLINIPANRVQSHFDNRFANTATAQDLNRAYLDGCVIDTPAYANKKYSTVHCPVALKLTRERRGLSAFLKEAGVVRRFLHRL